MSEYTKSVTSVLGGLAPYIRRRVIGYLDARLPASVTVAELAQIAELSVSHFSREFKRSVGTSPHCYIQQRRLKLAAEIIVRTVRPLADIALEIGFSDQSHFTRSFTRCFGATPRQFRRAYTGEPGYGCQFSVTAGF